MDSIKGQETVHVEDAPSVSSKWNIMGHKFPRREVVYFSQTFIIYIVILACLINISIGNGESNLWVALLGSCLGYILPHPSMPEHDRPFLHHITQQ